MGRRRRKREEPGPTAPGEIAMRKIVRESSICTGAHLRSELSRLESVIGSAHLRSLLSTTRCSPDATALHAACGRRAATDAAEVLLSFGANPDIRGHNALQAAPLHIASREGRADIVKILLEAGARVDALQAASVTPLLLAARAGQLDVARILLNAGARTDLSDSRGETPAHAAARACTKVLVEILEVAEARGELQNVLGAKTAVGRTLLHVAARAGNVDSVEILLSKSVNLEQRDASGMSALHDAAVEGHVETIQILKRNGCAGDADVGGLTPLHHAAMGGYVDCLRILESECGKIDSQGLAAVDLAVLHGMEQAAIVLVDMGERIRDDVRKRAAERKYGEWVWNIGKED